MMLFAQHSSAHGANRNVQYPALLASSFHRHLYSFLSKLDLSIITSRPHESPWHLLNNNYTLCFTMLLHDPGARCCSSQHEQTHARGKQVLEPPEPHSQPERCSPCHLFKGNACTTSLTKALELLKLMTMEPKHLLSSVHAPSPSFPPQCFHQKTSRAQPDLHFNGFILPPNLKTCLGNTKLPPKGLQDLRLSLFPCPQLAAR